MKKLLIDIQDRLLSSVPALKYVDMDWGQLSFYFPNPPVQWPCALINLQQASYSNVLKRAQLGLVTIVISIADLRLGGSSGKAPQNQKDLALSIFDLMESVFKALHGWTGDKTYSGLIRERYTQQQRGDGMTIHQMVFTTELKDSAATPVFDLKQASPKVIVNLQH